MYDTILYPTDGSASAAGAMETVQGLAELTGATVHVLHAIDARPAALGLGDDPQPENAPGMVGSPDGDTGGMGGQRSGTAELRAQLRENANDLVSQTAAELADVSTETAVRQGVPHDVILSYTAESDADVIVMGTQGRSGLSRYLLGSVTEKVVRMADVPVVTTRDGEEA